MKKNTDHTYTATKEIHGTTYRASLTVLGNMCEQRNSARAMN